MSFGHGQGRATPNRRLTGLKVAEHAAPQRMAAVPRTAASVGPPVKSGMLLKRGALNKAWKERWFELQGRTLSYMKSRGDKPLALVDLSTPGAFQVRMSQTEPAPFAFEVVTRTRLYMLRANTQQDLDDWFHVLTNIAALPPENATMAKAEEMLRVIMLRRAASLEELNPISPSSSMSLSQASPNTSGTFRSPAPSIGNTPSSSMSALLLASPLASPTKPP